MCVVLFRVNHSKNAIVKPQGKTPEMAQREVDEAMRKVREATQVISTSIDPSELLPQYTLLPWLVGLCLLLS